MFRFADLDRVIWPVRIGDAEFRGVFRILDRKTLRMREQDAARALAGKLEADGAPRTADDVVAMLEGMAERQDADEAMLRERVLGWYDVEDPQGAPLAFSVERLDALLATDYGYKALMAALMQASRDGPGKNSLPGPAGQPARDQA